jgi:hypothetical protein
MRYTELLEWKGFVHHICYVQEIVCNVSGECPVEDRSEQAMAHKDNRSQRLERVLY